MRSPDRRHRVIVVRGLFFKLVGAVLSVGKQNWRGITVCEGLNLLIGQEELKSLEDFFQRKDNKRIGRSDENSSSKS
jgi:hypothetical protein